MEIRRAVLEEFISACQCRGTRKDESPIFGATLQKQYEQQNNAQFVLLGDVGSGKSVAMGVIARTIWAIEHPSPLAPVLLTFPDIKAVKSKEGLEKIIVQNLEHHQFEEGKQTNHVEKFIAENLYNGNVLLLLDGFDELEKSNHFDLARFMNQFFQTYPQIPFLLSSRIVVWKQNSNSFPSLNFETIEMADLTPYEIHLFVYKWEFAGNKSGEHLAEIINSKVYLKSIATNPLMLTIITFLYVQSKRILPDNRVKFYQECVDVLLKKWGNAKQLARANDFESIDKVTILSALAYRHIINAQTTDEEISKKWL